MIAIVRIAGRSLSRISFLDSGTVSKCRLTIRHFHVHGRATALRGPADANATHRPAPGERIGTSAATAGGAAFSVRRGASPVTPQYGNLARRFAVVKPRSR